MFLIRVSTSEGAWAPIALSLLAYVIQQTSTVVPDSCLLSFGLHLTSPRMPSQPPANSPPAPQPPPQPADLLCGSPQPLTHPQNPLRPLLAPKPATASPPAAQNRSNTPTQ